MAKNARPLLKGSDHIRTAAAGLLLHALPAKKAEKLLKSAMTDANRAYRNAVLSEADAALGTEAVVAAVADKSFQKLSGSAKADIVRYLGNWTGMKKRLQPPARPWARSAVSISCRG